MVQTRVWDNIDRNAFFENAIILEVKCRSQGRSIKTEMSNVNGLRHTVPNEKYPFPVRDLLDDISLVVSGSGGADNVSAVCLEVSESHQHVMVLRLARNGGMNETILQNLRSLIGEVIEALRSGLVDEDVRDLALRRILARCRSRNQKHIANLHRVLSCIEPSITLRHLDMLDIGAEDVAANEESLEDIRILGKYCKSTHPAFVNKQQSRLEDIRNLSARSAQDFANTDLKDLQRLVLLAYQVRKSSTFRRILHENIRSTISRKSATSLVNETVERLGQLSKFARAAATMTKHLRRMLQMNVMLLADSTPSKTIQVPELSRTDSYQLRARGGYRCNNVMDARINGMTARWSKYREHAEIQLVMFYTENPTKILHTKYIGCNKQSCFLCFNFMTQHGRFHVSGCHQSLYSLWTIRDTINTASEEAIARITDSLTCLSKTLERKVAELRNPSWRHSGGTGKESVANLSRPSFALSDDIADNMSAVRHNAAQDSRHQETESSSTSGRLDTVNEARELMLDICPTADRGPREWQERRACRSFKPSRLRTNTLPAERVRPPTKYPDSNRQSWMRGPRLPKGKRSRDGTSARNHAQAGRRNRKNISIGRQYHVEKEISGNRDQFRKVPRKVVSDNATREARARHVVLERTSDAAAAALHRLLHFTMRFLFGTAYLSQKDAR